MLYPATGNIVLNTAFYQNGIKMAEGNYIDQKKDGNWKYYNDLGEPALENWSKGLPAGVWKVYYQGLKVMEEFTYRNGLKRKAHGNSISQQGISRRKRCISIYCVRGRPSFTFRMVQL